MKIKALSLWQPWASLIAVGAKRYETRHWKTMYHGPLLICAAKRKPDPAIVLELNIQGNLRQRFPRGIKLPLGMAVAIVNLSICISTSKMVWPWSWTEEAIEKEKVFGDFSPGRFAWKLENVRAIEPFPVTGRQGLFEVEIPEGLI